MRKLTNDQARRLALAAQGFVEGRPPGRIGVRHFRKVVDRVGLIQLDSVNVFSRTHYMPFFSRLGPYDRKALDEWLWRSGEMFEYWGHMASVIPSRDHRLFRWRMDHGWSWSRAEQLLADEPGYLESVLQQVRERGPLKTSDLDDPGERGSGMWNWSNGKVALEMLFIQGRVTTADRPNFTRLYDLTERVIPAQYLDGSEPGHEESLEELLVLATGHLGVGTADDLADYYRIRMPMARPVIDRLAESGRIVQVEVEGWAKPAYLHPAATVPRRAGGTALLSPFDNLIWDRDRVERIWDFRYRIEIYVPEAKREYGYYVLPFLLDGDLVARVDLKTDRKGKALLVKGAFGEPGIDRARVGRALRAELDQVASWLDLDDVVVSKNGDLAGFL
jgi:uncharacterized protein YcaQ